MCSPRVPKATPANSEGQKAAPMNCKGPKPAPTECKVRKSCAYQQQGADWPRLPRCRPEKLRLLK